MTRNVEDFNMLDSILTCSLMSSRFANPGKPFFNFFFNFLVLNQFICGWNSPIGKRTYFMLVEKRYHQADPSNKQHTEHSDTWFKTPTHRQFDQLFLKMCTFIGFLIQLISVQNLREGRLPSRALHSEFCYLPVRKPLTRHWLLPDPPTMEEWADIVNEIYTMEKNTFSLHLQMNRFIKLWSNWVSYIQRLQPQRTQKLLNKGIHPLSWYFFFTFSYWQFDTLLYYIR